MISPKMPFVFSSGRPVLCWVMSDIGQYHWARITALAQSAPMDLCVLQVGDRSGYAEFKRRDTSAAPCRIETIFQGQNHSQVPAKMLATEIAERLDSIRPAMVCAQGWSLPFALATLNWCVARRVPCMVASETQRQDEQRTWLREMFKRRIVRSFVAGLVGGRPHADYLCELGLPQDRVFVGYDVVDNAYFAAGSDDARNHAASERTRLGLPDRYFLACAQFQPKKNLVHLIQAFGEYRSLYTKSGVDVSSCWKLVILGDGSLRPDVERIRGELGLKVDVILPGFKTYDELPSYYGLAGAFVHASLKEQWGLVVNEAMAAGLPVLVSKSCGCATDLVEEGRNGFTFDALDTNEMGRLMFKVAVESDRIAMGLESRRIIGNWTPAVFARNFWQAVEEGRLVSTPVYSLCDHMLMWLMMRCRSQ